LSLISLFRSGPTWRKIVRERSFLSLSLWFSLPGPESKWCRRALRFPFRKRTRLTGSSSTRRDVHDKDPGSTARVSPSPARLARRVDMTTDRVASGRTRTTRRSVTWERARFKVVFSPPKRRDFVGGCLFFIFVFRFFRTVHLSFVCRGNARRRKRARGCCHCIPADVRLRNQNRAFRRNLRNYRPPHAHDKYSVRQVSSKVSKTGPGADAVIVVAVSGFPIATAPVADLSYGLHFSVKYFGSRRDGFREQQ